MAKKKGPTPKRRAQQTQPRPTGSPLSTRVLVASLAVGGVLVVAAAFALARTGDDGASADGRVDDAGPVHVHGLGINPADESLLIATHTGTYRVARDESRARRIGNSRQDTMGFTVVGPNVFLGSGHPDLAEAFEQDLPPHLGLIESRDAGRTWRNVSLLGEADFHVLRFAGKRVYGYDSSGDRLLVSGNNGRSWHEARRPAPLLDLAVDPGNDSRLVASAEGGLYVSADGGTTWRRIAPRVGLLAWPARERLYLVDAEGAVLRSSNGGRAWSRVGSVDGAPAAFLAQTVDELYLALHDGTILQSRDAGRTWSVRSSP